MILIAQQKQEMKGAVQPLLNGIVRKNQSIRRPVVEYRTYRGKRQFVIGYEWQRPAAGRINGVVHETVLGWGETFEAAIAKAKQKIEA